MLVPYQGPVAQKIAQPHAAILGGMGGNGNFGNVWFGKQAFMSLKMSKVISDLVQENQTEIKHKLRKMLRKG